MRRVELAALRSSTLPWDQLAAVLPRALEAIGLAADEGGSEGQLTVQDLGAMGCVVLLDDCALARQAALALATRAQVAIELFEVVGTAGTKQMRFRTTAFLASAKGELKGAEGKELDLEDPAQTWGGGTLADRTQRVLGDFALLSSSAGRTLRIGYRRRPAGRPSTPRVATLLAALQKSRSHQAVPQPDGRIELRIELAAGGKQTSFCSAAELEELERLRSGKR